MPKQQEDENSIIDYLHQCSLQYEKVIIHSPAEDNGDEQSTFNAYQVEGHSGTMTFSRMGYAKRLGNHILLTLNQGVSVTGELLLCEKNLQMFE